MIGLQSVVINIYKMAAPKIKTLIQFSIKSKVVHHAIIKGSFFNKEGEEIRYEENEHPKSLNDVINRNGDDVLNWNLVFTKTGQKEYDKIMK